MTLAVTAETIERLLARVDALERRNVLLERENAQLRARVAELERRLGLDSGTSSKPPSSDGPAPGRCGGPAACASAGTGSRVLSRVIPAAP